MEVFEVMTHTDYLPTECTHAMVNTSTTPLDLIILLYDSAIDHIQRAHSSIQVKNDIQKGYHLSKTIAIIEELTASLNITEGGEVALNLQNLYVRMLRELSIASVKDDMVRVSHVGMLLKELRYAWRQLR